MLAYVCMCVFMFKCCGSCLGRERNVYWVIMSYCLGVLLIASTSVEVGQSKSSECLVLVLNWDQTCSCTLTLVIHFKLQLIEESVLKSRVWLGIRGIRISLPTGHRCPPAQPPGCQQRLLCAVSRCPPPRIAAPSRMLHRHHASKTWHWSCA